MSLHHRQRAHNAGGCRDWHDGTGSVSRQAILWTLTERAPRRAITDHLLNGEKPPPVPHARKALHPAFCLSLVARARCPSPRTVELATSRSMIYLSPRYINIRIGLEGKALPQGWCLMSKATNSRHLMVAVHPKPMPTHGNPVVRTPRGDCPVGLPSAIPTRDEAEVCPVTIGKSWPQH